MRCLPLAGQQVDLSAVIDKRKFDKICPLGTVKFNGINGIQYDKLHPLPTDICHINVHCFLMHSVLPDSMILVCIVVHI